MKRPVLALLGALMLGLGGAVQAAIIYDNGGPNLIAGNEMTEWIQAEDFTLAAGATITDVHFWSVEQIDFDGFNSFTGSIDYAFYSDNGGSPNLLLEGFLAGTGLTRTCTGRTLPFRPDLNECEYSFDVAPFAATAGVTYWLALHNGPLTTDARLEFYWETTDPNGTFAGHEDQTPFDGVWDTNFAEHAYQLTGNAPEPATLALLGLGLAGLGFSRRSRAR